MKIKLGTSTSRVDCELRFGALIAIDDTMSNLFAEMLIGPNGDPSILVRDDRRGCPEWKRLRPLRVSVPRWSVAWLPLDNTCWPKQVPSGWAILPKIAARVGEPLLERELDHRLGVEVALVAVRAARAGLRKHLADRRRPDGIPLQAVRPLRVIAQMFPVFFRAAVSAMAERVHSAAYVAADIPAHRATTGR